MPPPGTPSPGCLGCGFVCTSDFLEPSTGLETLACLDKLMNTTMQESHVHAGELEGEGKAGRGPLPERQDTDNSPALPSWAWPTHFQTKRHFRRAWLIKNFREKSIHKKRRLHILIGKPDRKLSHFFHSQHFRISILRGAERR